RRMDRVGATRPHAGPALPTPFRRAFPGPARGPSYTSGTQDATRAPQRVRSMHFSNGKLSLMVLVSLVLASFLTLVLGPAGLRERRRRRRRDPADDRRLNTLVVEQARSIQRLEAAVRQLALGQKQLGELAGEAMRHVAVVRFDAFEDMGGRLSFS